jgi:hypothetical protein
MIADTNGAASHVTGEAASFRGGRIGKLATSLTITLLL